MTEVLRFQKRGMMPDFQPIEASRRMPLIGGLKQAIRYYLAPGQQPENMAKLKNAKENASCTQLREQGKTRLHPAGYRKPYGTRVFRVRKKR